MVILVTFYHQYNHHQELYCLLPFHLPHIIQISVNVVLKQELLLPKTFDEYKGNVNYSNKSRRKHRGFMYFSLVSVHI